MLHVFWSIVVHSGASTAMFLIGRLQSLILVRHLCYSDKVFLVNETESLYIFFINCVPSVA